MKKTIKVMAIYMASTHIPTLRCIGFSSSYLAITSGQHPPYGQYVGTQYDRK